MSNSAIAEIGKPFLVKQEIAGISIVETGLWLGYIATPSDGILDEDLFARALLLRGNVYVDELEWLPASALDDQGKELDHHDRHSSHLAMVDRFTFGADVPFVFANLRYIEPETDDDQLPVEQEFGLDINAGEARVEMSRFMSRHIDPSIQALASVAMISHTVGLLIREGLAGYATLEIPLLRRVKAMGLSVTQLTPIKKLESYGNTKNCAVRINGNESLVKARAIAANREDFPYARFFEIAVSGCNDELVQEIFVNYIKTKQGV